MPEGQGHWFEIAGAAVSFGAAVMAFLRGLQAMKSGPPVASDNLQDRMARLERRQELSDAALMEVLQQDARRDARFLELADKLRELRGASDPR